MALGGHAGAHTAVEKGNRWVRGVFAVLVLVMALTLVFGGR